MQFTIRIDRRTAAIVATGALLVGTLAACNDNTSSSQKLGQQVTEQYSQKLTNAQPYR